MNRVQLNMYVLVTLSFLSPNIHAEPNLPVLKELKTFSSSHRLHCLSPSFSLTHTLSLSHTLSVSISLSVVLALFPFLTHTLLKVFT